MTNSLFEKMPTIGSLYVKCPLTNTYFYENHMDKCDIEHSDYHYR